MNIDAKTLSPWPDFLRVMQNGRSLVVKAGGKTYDGPFDIDIDEATGEVVMDFGGEKKPAKKGVAHA